MKLPHGLIVIALLFVVAAPVWAPCNENGCTPYEEDPGDGCLGPTDPFCSPDDPGGGGSCQYENCSGCYRCIFIAVGPDPPHWDCDEAHLAGDHPYCTGYDWGCSMTGFCKIA